MSDNRREELEELAARVRNELETKGIPPEELNAALRVSPESAPNTARRKTLLNDDEPFNRRLMRARRRIRARRKLQVTLLALAILAAGIVMFRTSRVQGASRKPHIAVKPKPLSVVSAPPSTLSANPPIRIAEPEVQIVPAKTTPYGQEQTRATSEEKPAQAADVVIKPAAPKHELKKPVKVTSKDEYPVVSPQEQPANPEEKPAPAPKKDKPVVVYAAPRKEASPFDAYLGNSHPDRQEITPATPLDEDAPALQRRRSRTARTDDSSNQDLNRYYLERGLDDRRAKHERRVTVRVCVDSGELATQGCPHTALLNIPASDTPTRACHLHRAR
jgi:hypothetical protein